jgi:hypothetical protein
MESTPRQPAARIERTWRVTFRSGLHHDLAAFSAYHARQQALQLFPGETPDKIEERKRPKKPPELVALQGEASNILIRSLESTPRPVLSVTIETETRGTVLCVGCGEHLAQALRGVQPGQRVEAIGSHNPPRKGFDRTFWLRAIEPRE